MNFIPFNAGEGLPFQRPSHERAREMARHLHRHGILTKLRQSAGQDVDGGCGQLRARAVAKERMPPLVRRERSHSGRRDGRPPETSSA
jgi:23S rRNA (adenine2503-C2)-methyltransferase